MILENMKRIKIVTVFLLISTTMYAQQVVPLYTGKIPNSIIDTVSEKNSGLAGHQFIKDVTSPTLTVYLPEKEKATGTAVIICPGGGYGFLSISHEGYQVAKVFQNMGIAAFVIKYRLPSDKSMIDKSIGPLQDAQRAIQMVRQEAKEWHIDTSKVGIVGFSAGGHLAALAGTHYDKAYIENTENINLRPNFLILAYPVISFTDSLTHLGSRDNLIGKNPSKDKIIFFSNELHVTKNTPPAFLVHASDDKTVNVENSIIFYQALLAKGVNSEMLLYPKGRHGFGLNNSTTKDQWMVTCKNWMESNGWLNKKDDHE
jgi:acetyl esterase/lipase